METYHATVDRDFDLVAHDPCQDRCKGEQDDKRLHQVPVEVLVFLIQFQLPNKLPAVE